MESAAEKVYGGEEDGFYTVSLIPGVKWKPMGQEHLKVGFSTGIPISSEKEVDMTAFFRCSIILAGATVGTFEQLNIGQLNNRAFEQLSV